MKTELKEGKIKEINENWKKMETDIMEIGFQETTYITH